MERHLDQKYSDRHGIKSRRRHHPKRRGLLALTLLLTLTSCTNDKLADYIHGYPEHIEPLMRKGCAPSGCHTAQSAPAAGGLNLETWADLFKGSRGGSPVVPYAPDQSYLLYAVNNDSARGPILLPTMPIGMPALTPGEYEDLRQWILEGARNAKGEERFPPQSNRRKWYIGHYGCDYVAVFDAESKQVMRYVQVGYRPTTEQIYTLKVSPDQRHWYVVFSGFSSHIEKYSTLTDEKVVNIPLGHNGWNTMAFSPDSRFAFVVSEYLREVVVVDLEREQVVASPVTYFQNLHGPAVHPKRQQLYLTLRVRNGLYVYDYDSSGILSNPHQIDLTQTMPPNIPGNVWPNDIFFLPDGSKYFVTCWHSKEVRVLNGQTDALIDVIPVGDAPTNFAFSPSTGHLFVSCMDDTTTFANDPLKHGSIAVIDYRTHQLVKTIYAGFQPYGITVDETSGYLVVANRNTLQNGPGQHHESSCGGRNGYVTLIDLHTLDLVPDFKPELSVDPIAAALKQ